MTTAALPTADLRPPPRQHLAEHMRPAPIETILAVLARAASHAGETLSVTVTGPTHTVDVNVRDRAAYAAWRGTLPAAGQLVRDDDLGVLAETATTLYGWLLRVRIANP